MKKYLIMVLFVLLSLMLNAKEVEIDGLWYNLNTTGNTAEVIESQGDKYSGDLEIPAKITYDEVEYEVTTIGREAFYGCSAMTSIILPNSVISIEREAFNGCTSLTFINLPDHLKWINDGAFCGCTGLTSLTIPNSVLGIRMEAFASCRGLTSVILPDNLQSLSQSVFAGCTSLTSITIPNSVTVIGPLAFHGCTSLESITIPDNVTSIQGFAFRYCSSLASVTFSNSLTTIEEQAFYGCTSLTSITIPNSVTTIERYSFCECSELKILTLGSSVTEIQNGAFSGCNQITDVYCYPIRVPRDGSNIFSSYITEATLHVPSASIDLYREKSPWNTFKAIVALDVEATKCATPTITYANGKVRFACETEGVEFVPSIMVTPNQLQNGNELAIGGTFTVSVYAVKEGYDNSDTATITINMSQMGDVNADGELNAADVTAVVNAILGK